MLFTVAQFWEHNQKKKKLPEFTSNCCIFLFVILIMFKVKCKPSAWSSLLCSKVSCMLRCAPFKKNSDHWPTLFNMVMLPTLSQASYLRSLTDDAGTSTHNLIHVVHPQISKLRCLLCNLLSKTTAQTPFQKKEYEKCHLKWIIHFILQYYMEGGMEDSCISVTVRSKG